MCLQFGRPFTSSAASNISALSPESAAKGSSPLDAYLINSALHRQAIAPLWEVQTAKLQTNIGDPNAGLTEEERAAKCLTTECRLTPEMIAARVQDTRSEGRYGLTNQFAVNDDAWEVAA